MVLNRIPKQWFWSFGLPIILGIVFIILNAYALAQPIVENDLITLIFILSVGGVAFGFVFLIIIYALIIIGELKILHNDIKDGKSTSTRVLSKKNIRRYIEIQTLNNDIWEVDVSLKRKWLPTEIKPNVEDFISALSFSEPHCGLCKANIEMEYSHGNTGSYRCSNFDCKNSERKIPAGHKKALKSTIENQYAGAIRNDYDSYWEIYTAKYLELTDGKPEEYQDPLEDSSSTIGSIER